MYILAMAITGHEKKHENRLHILIMYNIKKIVRFLYHYSLTTFNSKRISITYINDVYSILNNENNIKIE